MDRTPAPLFEGSTVRMHRLEVLPDGNMKATVGMKPRSGDADAEKRRLAFEEFDHLHDGDWDVVVLGEMANDPHVTVAIGTRTPKAVAELRRLLAKHAGWQAPMGEVRYQVLGDVPANFSKVSGVSLEDGGQAMIAELDNQTETVGDDCIFVRLQSWKDEAHKEDPTSHPVLRSLMGRRVRITIEDMGPAE